MGAEFSDVNAPPMTIQGREVKMVNKLGEGGYSFVYLVEDTRSGEKYALKRCITSDPQQEELISNEIEIMKTLTEMNSGNIVKYLGSVTKKIGSTREFYILLEFCEGGSVLSHVQKNMDNRTKTNEKFILKIFHETLVALKVLHSRNISHRDIKIENILQHRNGKAKLCDFGSCVNGIVSLSDNQSVLKEQDRVNRYSTEMYRAPEMCDLYKSKTRGVSLGPKVDIFALGSVLYTMATFKHPFEEGGKLAILSGKVDYDEVRGYSPYLELAMRKCYIEDPNTRPDVDELLQYCDAWMEQFRTKTVDPAIQEELIAFQTANVKPTQPRARPVAKTLPKGFNLAAQKPLVDIQPKTATTPMNALAPPVAISLRNNSVKQATVVRNDDFEADFDGFDTVSLSSTKPPMQQNASQPQAAPMAATPVLHDDWADFGSNPTKSGDSAFNDIFLQSPQPASNGPKSDIFDMFAATTPLSSNNAAFNFDIFESSFSASALTPQPSIALSHTSSYSASNPPKTNNEFAHLYTDNTKKQAQPDFFADFM